MVGVNIRDSPQLQSERHQPEQSSNEPDGRRVVSGRGGATSIVIVTANALTTGRSDISPTVK